MSDIFGTTSNNGGINLFDYATIRNGSYKKLMKAYYKQEKSKTSAKKTDDSTQVKKLKEDSAQLQKAASELTSKSLWEKKEMTRKTEDGTEEKYEDYDWDAIKKAAKSFVDSYNSMLDSAAKSNNNSVLRSASIMTEGIKKSSKLLEDAGIKIGKDNKLSLSEDDLQKADMAVLKTAFTGYTSIASQVGQKATSINTTVNAGTKNYTSEAKYNKNLDALLSGKIDTEI